MALISWSTTSLISGISQQPDTLRFASQAEAQTNGFSSVVDGLTKRHPTEHVAELIDTTGLGSLDVAIHGINRDVSERYLVIFLSGSPTATAELKVWDIENEVFRVVEGPGGVGSGTTAPTLTYLDDTDPVKLRSMSVADTTFVVNPTVLVEMDDTVGDAMSTDAYIFVRSGLYESEYTVDMTLWTVSAGVSETISVTINTWDGDNSTNAKNKDQLAVSALDTSSRTVTFLGSEVTASSVAGFTNSINALNGLTATAITGSVMHVEGNYSGLDIRGAIVSGTGITLTELIAHDAAVEESIQTDDIAAALTAALAAATSNATFTRVGSVIRCVPLYDKSGNTVATGAPYFDALQLTDSNADSLMTLTHKKVDTVTNLPLTCTHGFKIEVQGNAESAEDNFYLEFEAKDSAFGAGTWKETVKGGEKYKLDASTMPHQLTRAFTTVGGTPYFVWEEATWGERKVGDETATNPFPSFVTTAPTHIKPAISRYISDIFFFRNRMGLLSNDNVVLSEVGVFENFFRTATTAILDSDPIDVGVGHSSVAILHSAVAWNEKLVLFSDQTQFILEGEPYLTPQTVQVSAVTDFENFTSIRPHTSGQGVAFGYAHGDYSGVRELKQVSENVYSAEDLTIAIPKFIKGTITAFAPTTLENMLVVQSDGSPSSLFIYKYYFGEGERLQAAWSEYTFGSDTTIEHVLFIENTLYIALRRAEGLFLEKMEVADGRADPNASYLTTLDRRITDADCSPTYDSATGVTTLTLPYAVAAGRDYQVVSRATATEEPGHIYTLSSTPSGTSIVVEGDLTGVSFWVGEKYTFSYQFSAPRLREATATRGGRGTVATGRQQAKYGTLVYDDSGHFTVSVTPKGRDAQVNTFSAVVLDSGSDMLGELSLDSGGFRFPIHSKNDQVDITLENDSPLPSNFVSIEWEADFTTQSKRYRG